MKRLIIIIVTGTLTLMFLLPNSSLASGVKGGIKLGVSSAKFHSDDLADLEALLGLDSKSRIGLCAGGFITFNITEMFAIQPEVLYTMKGAKYESEIFGETLKIWINLAYLEIPVLAKIIVPTPGRVKPSIFAGPVFALKLSSKIKFEALGQSSEEDIENMKGREFGLIIGAGLDFGFGALGKGKMTLDIRYNLALSKIYDVEGNDLKNGAFSLMVGFSF